MNQNPNIPQLFRDIFKNAYLPYRDPETLKSFLKEINDFQYDHSERLGDAYEFLLSILSSQGDAGQFRTPRHIIDFIAQIVNPKKNETILDPACGTAGFLISSYKHILKQNTMETLGDQLTTEEQNRLMTNLVGYDISPDMVRLSLVNMYLHGFPAPNIYEYDTLTSENRWNDTYDVIMANPPFMTPKGGIRPHKRFSVQAKRSEVLFVDYIAEHLNPGGRAGVIVPEGIIFQSQNAYKNLRKMLVEDYLWAVVSLPAGIFNPYSGVKTSILLMDKALSKRTDKILFVKVNNDGFDLGAQRRPIDKNDLPQALAFIKDYQKAVMADREVEETEFLHIVEKSRIAESGDWNLSGERYRKNDESRMSNYELVELGSVAEITSGQSPEGKYYNKIGKGIPFYQGKTEFGDMYIHEPQKWTTQVTKTAYKDDILISVRAPVGPINFASQEICIGRGLAAIRTSVKVNKFYLFYILRSMEDKIKGWGGAVFDSISRKQIQIIKIPLPPLEVQREIVAEIDGYQKIIDGAWQVVDNYKPTIKIDPEWEMVPLGEVFKLSSGKGLTQKEQMLGNYKVYGGNGIKGIHNKYFIEEPILIIGRVGAYCGAVHITEPKSWITDNALYVTEYLIKINQQYLAQVLKQLNLNQYAKVGGQPSISQTTVYRLKVPLPPLSVQQEIVTRIEEEQKLVDANKKLIEIYEQKIKDKIAEVWGK